MKIGVSTASFFPNYFTEDCFGLIKEIGADICEVFLSSFCEYEEDFTAKLIANKTVDVHSVHGMSNQYEPEIINRNSRVFADSKALFTKVCNVGQALGAKYYTFHGPNLLKRIKYSFDFPFIAERLNVLRNIAKERGLELCYENVHWAYFNSPEYILELKKHIPDISTCFDNKQAMQSKICYKEFINAMSDSIKTIHLCDYTTDGELKIPSEGDFDFTEMFTILKDKNINANCLMEIYSKNYTSLAQVKKAYEYLLNCYEKAKISI